MLHESGGLVDQVHRDALGHLDPERGILWAVTISGLPNPDPLIKYLQSFLVHLEQGRRLELVVQDVVALADAQDRVGSDHGGLQVKDILEQPDAKGGRLSVKKLTQIPNRVLFDIL